MNVVSVNINESQIKKERRHNRLLAFVTMTTLSRDIITPFQRLPLDVVFLVLRLLTLGDALSLFIVRFLFIALDLFYPHAVASLDLPTFFLDLGFSFILGLCQHRYGRASPEAWAYSCGLQLANTFCVAEKGFEVPEYFPRVAGISCRTQACSHVLGRRRYSSTLGSSLDATRRAYARERDLPP